MGDPLDEGVAADLNSAGGADGFSACGASQQARVVDVVRLSADRAEVGEDVPDVGQSGRYRATTRDVGRCPTVRGTPCITPLRRESLPGERFAE